MNILEFKAGDVIHREKSIAIPSKGYGMFFDQHHNDYSFMDDPYIFLTVGGGLILLQELDGSLFKLELERWDKDWGYYPVFDQEKRGFEEIFTVVGNQYIAKNF